MGYLYFIECSTHVYMPFCIIRENDSSWSHQIWHASVQEVLVRKVQGKIVLRFYRKVNIILLQMTKSY